MALNITNLQLDHNYTTGTTVDQSGSGNSGTLTNGEGFGVYNGDTSFFPQTSSSHILVSSDATLNVDAYTLVFYADFDVPFSSSQYFLDTRTGGNLYVQYDTSGTLLRCPGSALSSFTLSDPADYLGAKTFIITKGEGDVKPKLYIDGVLHSETNISAGTLDTDGASFFIGNRYTANEPLTDVRLKSFLFYSDEKTATEVVQIHNDVKKRKTIHKIKRNYDIGPQIKSVSSGSAYNMIGKNGRVEDLGPNDEFGQLTDQISTINGVGLQQALTPWGEPCFENVKGTNAHINMGTASSTAFTGGETWGYMGWIKHNDASGGVMMMSRSATYAIQLLNNNQIQFILGTTPYNPGINVYTDDNWHLVGMFTDGSDIYGMVDGVILGSGTITGTPTTGTLRIGQYIVNGFDVDGAIGPIAAYREFDDLADFTAFSEEEYKRVSRKVIYHEDFSDAYIHQGNFGAGSPVPGTEITVNTNNMLIDQGTSGDKGIRGTTFGSNGYAKHDGYPYGTWVIEFTAEANIRNIFSIIADDTGVAASNRLQVDFTGGGNNRLEFSDDVGALLQTATSSVYAGDHTLKIQITDDAANNATVFLDGVQVTPALGSNPFTSSKGFTDALYYNFASYGGGSNEGRIRSVTHYFGII